ncbi:MAG TPA: hypothetical protein VGH56_10360 [Solirubrobacteraceae bacterium]|jgi:hypothetical protein
MPTLLKAKNGLEIRQNKKHGGRWRSLNAENSALHVFHPSFPGPRATMGACCP